METSKIGTDVKELKEALLNGGVVAFPTETVMGLGVVFDNYEAYKKLNQLKGRPEDKPYTMMLGDVEDIQKFAYVDERAKKIIDNFMPGPLTILLQARENVPSWVTHNTGVIGIRVPAFDILLDILKYVNKPLLVPSANPSGLPPAKNIDKVLVYFNNSLDYIYYHNSAGGSPSTIIDLTGPSVKLIREGEVSLDVILNQIGEN